MFNIVTKVFFCVVREAQKEMHIWGFTVHKRVTIMKMLTTTGMLIACLSASGIAKADVFSIGANPQGSLGYTVSAAVAKAVEAHTDHKFRIVPNSGPVVNLPLVNNGELDFAIGITTVTAFAIEGREMFEGRPHSDLQLAVYLFPIYAGPYVRADSDIQQLSDLKGKKIPSEFTQQRITGLEVEAMLEMGGVSKDEIQPVPVPNGVRQIDEFINGRTDFFFFTSEAGKTIEADASVGGLRALPVPDDADSIETLNRILPGTLVELVPPGPSRPGISEPTKLLSLPFVLSVGKHVPADVVESMIEALVENQEMLVGVHGVFNKFDPKNVTQEVGIPYHEGAMNYAAGK